MKRLHPTLELMTEDISNRSGSCPSSRPVRVSGRIRGAARLSISEVTDQVLPDSDSGIKSKDVKSLSKSDNLEDEMYPSPKSKTNESCTTNAKVQRKRSKKEPSSSSTNAKRGRYANQKAASIGKGNASLEIRGRETDIQVDKEMSAKRLKVSGGKTKPGGLMRKATNVSSFSEIKTEQIIDGVDLNTSVSSVEVSADEKEEKVGTRCDWCKKKFDEKDWGKLNRHKKLSHDTPCPNCDLMFVDEMDLSKHIKEYHRSEAKWKNYAYECRKCLKRHQSFKDNLRHEEKEHPHKCRLCIVEKVIFPFSFINEKGLQVHEEQRHRSKFKEGVKIDLSNEHAILEGDESKESVESVELVVVKPKIIKGKKVSPVSKIKSSKKSKPKSEELQENVKVKKRDEKNIPESRKKADNKLTVDYSNLIKNESIVEGHEDNESARVMDTVQTNQEKKFDYSYFIVNESLQEDGIVKKVLTNAQVKEGYNWTSNNVKQEEYVNKVDKETKKVKNQSRSNAINSGEEQHLKEAELIFDGVKIEVKEPFVDREANEKGTEMQVNNVVLKRPSDDNIQDSEISTTSQNIPEVFNEESMIIGINSNEVRENYIIGHSEEKFETNKQDKDSWNNQENYNEIPEKPQQSSQQTSPSNKTLEQALELKVACESINENEKLDSPLVKDDKSSNCVEEVPKFSENSKEKSVPPVEKRKHKLNKLTVFSKVNGKLQVKPASASSTKSSRAQCKDMGNISGDRNSPEKLIVSDNNDCEVEDNKKVDGYSAHLSKEKQTISIQGINQDSESKLLGENYYPENVAELSNAHKENLNAIEAHSEDFKPPENFVSSISHKVGNLDDTMNPLIELDSKSSVDCEINNESSKNERNENLDGDKPFFPYPSPMPDALEDDNQAETFHMKLSLSKLNQEPQSIALDVNHFSERNFMESPIVSKEDSTIHNTFTNDSVIKEKVPFYANTESIAVSKEDSTVHDTFTNDCTIEENISSYGKTESIGMESLPYSDGLVMKKETNFNNNENVTPNRRTMPKPFNGLSLISTMYLNTSSETDSPFASHFPEVLVSDSPIGQPIGTSSPRHLKAESIPLKISKLQGIQSFKDPRPTREVWKVRKQETNTVPHTDVNQEVAGTIATLKSNEYKSTDKDSDIQKLDGYMSLPGGIVSPRCCEPQQEEVERFNDTQDEVDDNDMNGGHCHDNQVNDSLDEFGLDVIDSPEKKIETYDISNLLLFNPNYSALEPEKEKPKQLERDGSLTSIEELLESDEGDDDKPLKSDEQDDQQSTKKHQFSKVSDKTEGKAKLKIKKKRDVYLPCQYCDRTFNRESLLKNHMNFAHCISSKDSFVCDLCQHHFKHKGHLNDHLKIRHDYKCEGCSLRFHSRSQMESHSTDAHPDGSPDRTDLGEDDGLQVKPLECELCKAIFPWEEFVKHTELNHTYPCKLQLDPEANNAPHLWFVSSNDLAWHVHREHAGPRPDGEEKPKVTNQSQTENSNPENLERKSTFNCELSGQEDEIQKTFDEHKKRRHKYSLGSDFDQYVKLSNDSKKFESVTCCVCGLEFEEVQQFEKHSRILHPFACSHGDCQKRFTNQKNLSDHLTKEHSITYLKVYGEKNKIKLTATRSIANIEMIRSVEEWLRSEDVVEHLVRVMKGELKSRRHELFMDRKERAQSGGLKISKLYNLSNPAFMGDAGERDSSVVQYLIDEVFNPHFHSSDPRLQEVGINFGFAYATTVLFPEMFLNQHQVKNGFSKEEAERAFMEIEVTDEEREGLEQEIREAVVAQEEEEFSDDEWVDAPDVVENDYENTTIIVDNSD